MGCVRRDRVRPRGAWGASCTGGGKAGPGKRGLSGLGAHPFTPIAPVTSGACSGYGCARGEQGVRPAGSGALAGVGQGQPWQVGVSLAGAHPFTPIAPVTSGACGGIGCARGELGVRRARAGARPALASGGSLPRAHPFTPIAPVTSGACGGYGCARGEQGVRPEGTWGACGGKGCAPGKRAGSVGLEYAVIGGLWKRK